MTLTNRDASQITIKNRQKALYGWKSYAAAALASGTTVLQEQSKFQTLDVVVDRQQGGCKCSNDASENPYQFNGLSSQANVTNF
jgi:hypothetical protein